MDASPRNCVLVALLLLGTPTILAQTGPVPRIVLSQPSWDFGSVWQDEKAVFVLTVRNEGSADLVIRDVRTTCGCTVAQPERNTIPPGQTTTIRVEYDTHGKQGDQESKVLIFSNDPRKYVSDPQHPSEPGEVHFHVKGKVKRAIVREPLGGLVVKTTDGLPGQTGSARLKNELDQPMKLELVSNSFPELDIKVNEIVPGKEYEVVGRTTRMISPGTLKGEIVFKTGLDREPEYTLHARIQILWKLESSPPAMLFRANDPAPQRRIINFQYYGEDGVKGFNITGFSASHPEVQITVGPTKPAHGWMHAIKPPITAYADAQIALPPPARFPPEGIVLTFTTDNKQRPKIDVLVTTNKEAFEAKMYAPPAPPAPLVAP